MTAREQLALWGADPEIELFISAGAGSNAPTVARAKGKELLERIAEIDIHPANELTVQTVNGVRFVSIAGTLRTCPYRILITPVDPFTKLKTPTA